MKLINSVPTKLTTPYSLNFSVFRMNSFQAPIFRRILGSLYHVMSKLLWLLIITHSVILGHILLTLTRSSVKLKFPRRFSSFEDNVF